MDLSSKSKIENLEELLQIANISPQKICRKNRPTFLVLSDDRISKMRPQHFNAKFDKFKPKFEKEMNGNLVWSLRDLAESLREFN